MIDLEVSSFPNCPVHGGFLDGYDLHDLFLTKLDYNTSDENEINKLDKQDK